MRQHEAVVRTRRTKSKLSKFIDSTSLLTLITVLSLINCHNMLFNSPVARRSHSMIQYYSGPTHPGGHKVIAAAKVLMAHAAKYNHITDINLMDH